MMETIRQNPYDISTVAWSIYNAIASRGVPVETEDDGLDSLFGYLRHVAHFDLEKGFFEEALEALKDRGFLVEKPAGLDVRDHKRRILIQRDREEFKKTGDGWAGWKIRDPRRGLIPFEEIAR